MMGICSRPSQTLTQELLYWTISSKLTAVFLAYEHFSRIRYIWSLYVMLCNYLQALRENLLFDRPFLPRLHPLVLKSKKMMAFLFQWMRQLLRLNGIMHTFGYSCSLLRTC